MTARTATARMPSSARRCVNVGSLAPSLMTTPLVFIGIDGPEPEQFPHRRRNLSRESRIVRNPCEACFDTVTEVRHGGRRVSTDLEVRDQLVPLRHPLQRLVRRTGDLHEIPLEIENLGRY